MVSIWSSIFYIFMIDFQQVYPYQAIKEDFLVRRDGAIVAGFALWQPPIFEQDEKQATNVNGEIDNIIKRLPPGTTIQKMDFLFAKKYEPQYTEKDSIIQREMSVYYDSRSMLGHYSNIYLIFNPNYKIKKSAKYNPLISDALHASQAWKTTTAEFYKKAKSSFETTLSAFNSLPGYKASCMNSEDLKEHQKRYFNLQYNANEKPSDVVNPLENKDDQESIKIGGAACKIVFFGQRGRFDY